MATERPGEGPGAELVNQLDSITANVSALRLGIAKIELLEGYKKLLRDMLADCRIEFMRTGNRTMVKQIDSLLSATLEA